ncbi:uncharacterized protein JN550_010298 [Neoarthrinium moseri]|uniref:uncharacterized protein n=1 Tax=Neoarthrinium moseri TaxID=1658444 RepID=UPI001FDB0214|nr:uncharacterized protein JN550_010298 [Neoarthrinium moseri]KAI1862291.1 hypothetical protein JN550_010298 [Neoarthrinium moseri]
MAEQPQASAVVRTDKCFIRPYARSDAEALSAAANHEDISRYMTNRFPHPYTLDSANFWINHSLEHKPHVNFAICLPDGTFAGGIGLVPGSDIEYRTWELGYWVAMDHWGKGLATSAVSAFCKWAFTAFSDLHRLDGRVVEGNEGSMKVLEKAGFVKEGVRRKAVYKHGMALDHVMFGLLRQDIKD